MDRGTTRPEDEGPPRAASTAGGVGSGFGARRPGAFPGADGRLARLPDPTSHRRRSRSPPATWRRATWRITKMIRFTARRYVPAVPLVVGPVRNPAAGGRRGWRRWRRRSGGPETRRGGGTSSANARGVNTLTRAPVCPHPLARSLLWTPGEPSGSRTRDSDTASANKLVPAASSLANTAGASMPQSKPRSAGKKRSPPLEQTLLHPQRWISLHLSKSRGRRHL